MRTLPTQRLPTPILRHKHPSIPKTRAVYKSTRCLPVGVSNAIPSVLTK